MDNIFTPCVPKRFNFGVKYLVCLYSLMSATNLQKNWITGVNCVVWLGIPTCIPYLTALLLPDVSQGTKVQWMRKQQVPKWPQRVHEAKCVCVCMLCVLCVYVWLVHNPIRHVYTCSVCTCTYCVNLNEHKTLRMVFTIFILIFFIFYFFINIPYKNWYKIIKIHVKQIIMVTAY